MNKTPDETIYKAFSKIILDYAQIFKRQGGVKTSREILVRMYGDKYFGWATSEPRRDSPLYNIIYTPSMDFLINIKAFKSKGTGFIKFMTDNNILIVIVNIAQNQLTEENRGIYENFLSASTSWEMFKVNGTPSFKSSFNVLNVITSKDIDSDAENFIGNVILIKK
jgi:hypothetical protein